MGFIVKGDFFPEQIQWNFNDGKTAAVDTPVVDHIFDTPRTYSCSVIVKNRNGSDPPYTFSVNIIPEPTPKLINGFNQVKSAIYQGGKIGFDLTSDIPDGGIQRIVWDWDNDGDNIDATTRKEINAAKKPSHQFNRVGEHYCSVTLYAESDSSVKRFFVIVGNTQQ